jgi:CheY-like chemotaxis protein
MSDTFSATLRAAWLRNLATQDYRVAQLESAIVALLAGTLDPSGYQLCAREAHKLAGSLGSFGFQKASRLASEIETAWTSGEPIDLTQMAQSVAALRRHLQQHADDSVEAAPALASGNSESLDILLVDDDQVFADFALSALRRRDYRVDWVADGQSARTALCGADAPFQPRLILLDLEMPGLDGFGLLEDLARSEVVRRSAVVMLTRHRAPEDIVRARRLGVVDYLAKPLLAPTLINRVRRVLAA